MNYLIPILDNCKIPYQIIEENNLSFIYDELEFTSFTEFIPEYNILHVRIESEPCVNCNIKTIIQTNQLRSEYSSYAAYPNLGISFFYIDIPLRMEDKETYFMNELDKIVHVLKELDEPQCSIYGAQFQESFADLELNSFIDKEYHNESMFEENIIHDALDIIDQKDLLRFYYEGID